MTQITIDDLMDLDPLELTDDHIDAIIAHHRHNRAQLEQGIKPKKEAKSVSLDSVVNALVVKATGELPEKPKLNRRI